MECFPDPCLRGIPLFYCLAVNALHQQPPATPHPAFKQLAGDQNGLAEANLLADQTELRKMKTATLGGRPSDYL